LALQRVADGIGLEAAPVTPPPALKSKVFQRIGVPMPAAGRDARDVIREFTPPARPSPWQRLMPLALAASVLIAAGALYYAATLRRDVTELTKLVRIMQAPDLVRADLKGQATASGAIGRAMWSRTAGMVFTADRLPRLPEGRVYQLWTITGTAATSAGLLAPDANGSATLRIDVRAGAPAPNAFGVTIEPAGGSPAPTLPIVLLGVAGQ